MRSKSVVLNTGKIDTLVHVSGGNCGLIKDAANGALTNGRTGNATVLQGNGLYRGVIAGETRYINARRDHNYVVDYNDFSTANWTREGGHTAVGDTITFAVSGDSNTNRVRQQVDFKDPRQGRQFMLIAQVSTSDLWSDPTATLTIAAQLDNAIGAAKTCIFTGGYSTQGTSAVMLRSAVSQGTVSALTTVNIMLYVNKAVTIPSIKVALFDVTGDDYKSPVNDVLFTDNKKYSRYKNPFITIACWGDSLPVYANGNVSYLLAQYYGDNRTSANILEYYHGYGGASSTTVKTNFLADGQHSDKIILIWCGHNSFNRTTVKADIAEMVAAIPHDRYIIVSMVNGTANPVGVGDYAEIMACNADLSALYPGHYVDVRAALIAAYDPGTPQDVTDVANDIVPSTLRYDDLHLNSKGAHIAAFTIFNFAKANGLFNSLLVDTYNPSMLHEPATTNLATNPRDFTNAAWVKTNISAAKDATGIDGVTNGACTLTASADNATVLQTITSASAQRITGCGIKRKTGTGVINMTQDNGSTWTPVTVTSSWTLVKLSAVTSANPVFGLQIVTNTDAIYVDYFQHELGAYITSPISGSRVSDSIKLPYSANVNFRHDKGIVLLKLKMKYANSASNKSLFAANTGATDFIYDDGSGNIALKDGTNTATATVGGWTTDDILLIGACYDDKAGKMSIHVSKNGGAWIDSTDTTYDGAFPAGSNLVWCSSNTDTVEILSTKVFRSTKGFTKMQNWIKNRAASEAV